VCASRLGDTVLSVGCDFARSSNFGCCVSWPGSLCVRLHPPGGARRSNKFGGYSQRPLPWSPLPRLPLLPPSRLGGPPLPPWQPQPRPLLHYRAQRHRHRHCHHQQQRRWRLCSRRHYRCRDGGWARRGGERQDGDAGGFVLCVRAVFVFSVWQPLSARTVQWATMSSESITGAVSNEGRSRYSMMSCVDLGISGERSYMRPMPETVSCVHERQRAVEAPVVSINPKRSMETSCGYYQRSK